MMEVMDVLTSLLVVSCVSEWIMMMKMRGMKRGNLQVRQSGGGNREKDKRERGN